MSKSLIYGRTPNGLTFRSLRRAFNAGWRPSVKVKKERAPLYLNSHARAMESLKQALARR